MPAKSRLELIHYYFYCKSSSGFWWFNLPNSIQTVLKNFGICIFFGLNLFQRMEAKCMYGWYQINKFIKNWSSAWLSFWALASAIFCLYEWYYPSVNNNGYYWISSGFLLCLFAPATNNFCKLNPQCHEMVYDIPYSHARNYYKMHNASIQIKEQNSLFWNVCSFQASHIQVKALGQHIIETLED